MFYCAKCKKSSQSGEKKNMVVVQTRDKTYVNPILDFRGKLKYDKSGKKLEKVTQGYETVREVGLCGRCYE